MRRTRSVLLAPALVALVPALLSAQSSLAVPAASAVGTPAVMPSMVTPTATASAPATTPLPEAARPVAGPVAGTQSVALQHRLAPAPAPRVPRANTANNRALVIVGAAGVIVGALIGDDAGTVVILGSAAIGLVGLYRLLT